MRHETRYNIILLGLSYSVRVISLKLYMFIGQYLLALGIRSHADVPYVGR